MTNNMGGVEGITELQRQQVVNILMRLLKSFYPAEHEYLLRRARQYESMCYSSASNIQHYYQLVNEGVGKIRNSYNDQAAVAGNFVSADSVRQRENSAIRNGQNSAAMQNASKPIYHPPNLPNNFSAPGISNPSNPSIPIPSASPPVSVNPSFPIPNLDSNTSNFIKPPNSLNPPSTPINPFSQQAKEIPATKENCISSPAARLSQTQQQINAQVNRMADPTLNHMIPFPDQPVINTPFNSMGNTTGNQIANTAHNAPFNRMSSQMPSNQFFNLGMTPSVNPGISNWNNSMNCPIQGQIPLQLSNRMANVGQTSVKNPFPQANQMSMATFNPPSNLPRNKSRGSSQIQGAVQNSQLGHQSEGHSEDVDQFLLSIGMIPSSMLNRAPQSTRNIYGGPRVNSNQRIETSGAPIQVPGYNTFSGSRTKPSMAQRPISVTERVTSQPNNASGPQRGRTASRALSPSSMISSEFKGTRPIERPIQRSRSRKRNYTAAKIEQTSPPTPTKNLQNQRVLNQAPDQIRSHTATKSFQQAPGQAIANVQQHSHFPNPSTAHVQEDISLSNPDMSARIFISDGIHVSVRQIYTAAETCGYKLTPEIIKNLSREQLLRIFVRARQIILKNTSNFARRDNGRINLSKEDLDALGVEYETTDGGQHQSGNLKENPTDNQDSALQLAKHLSSPANIKVNRSDKMTPARNIQSGGGQNNPIIQSTHMKQEATRFQSPKFNSAGISPNHRTFRKGGVSNKATQMANSNKCLSSSLTQETGNQNANRDCKKFSQAPVISSARTQENAAQGGAHTPPSLSETTATRITGNHTTAFSRRIRVFRQKYAVYKSLIHQTLSLLLSQGLEGKNQVRYLRYSLQLLTQPAEIGPELTPSVLNTTENFLRGFLVRCQGVSMKSQSERSNQAGASKAAASAGSNVSNPKGDSKAQIHPATRATVAKKPRIEIDKEPWQRNNVETAHASIENGQVQISSNAGNAKVSGVRQEHAQVATTFHNNMPFHPVPQGRNENSTNNGAPGANQNMHSLIARKLHRVNHFVRIALHETEKSLKRLEQESNLRLKEERIAEVCYVIQADTMRKTCESDGFANHRGVLQPSLLQLVTEECRIIYEKHKKLMINIEEKWEKPVVECLLAYQNILLPKIVIHIGGTYRKDFSATFGFQRPPLGWVPVLSDIKERFTAMVKHTEGVSGIIESWAVAAAEVLGNDDIC